MLFCAHVVQGVTNVQGEEQKKLDVVANHNFVNLLTHTGKACVLVSEEVRTPNVLPSTDALLLWSRCRWKRQRSDFPVPTRLAFCNTPLSFV